MRLWFGPALAPSGWLKLEADSGPSRPTIIRNPVLAGEGARIGDLVGWLPKELLLPPGNSY